MATPDYRVLQLDLATVRSAPGAPEIPSGVVVESIVPLFIPAGSGLTVSIGDNHDPIPLEFMPSLEICPPADEGLRFINPLGAGIATVLIGITNVVPSS